jgi:hypothetical protein
VLASLDGDEGVDERPRVGGAFKCAISPLIFNISPLIFNTYNAGMCALAHPMLQNTSKEHKSSTCAPPNSKWPP